MITSLNSLIKTVFKKNSAIQIANNSQFSNHRKDKIKKQLFIIEEQLKITIRDLWNAQLVSIRSTLSKQNGLLYSLQSTLYRNAANNSAKFHIKQLIDLQRQRRILQRELDYYSGTLWKKKLITILTYLILTGISLFILWLLIMGLITAIYLLPVWGSIILIYWLTRKLSRKYF